MLPRPMELMLSIMHKGGYGFFNLGQLTRLPRATADQGPFATAGQTESLIMFRPMRDELSERGSATFGRYKPNSVQTSVIHRVRSKRQERCRTLGHCVVWQSDSAWQYHANRPPVCSLDQTGLTYM